MKALFPYEETTRGLIVRVAPTFLPEQSIQGERWFWAYHIRIENESDMTAQLISRRWVITDARGAKQIVEGDGVVGEQPVIQPGQSFDYVSGCPLTTSSGTMEGSYVMHGEDGSEFEIAIPCFLLATPVGVQVQ